MGMDKIGLLEIENLSYAYPGCEEAALKDVTLSVRQGEFLLLLGASGSGKSTLCRAVNGLVPHFYGGRIEGSVRVDGTETVSSTVAELSRTVGMVFQDPENQMVTDNTLSEVAFGLENTGLDRLQMRKRVEEVLASLRLSDMRDSSINELSGGQKQKVALASVLVMHPKVLVLDEPTSQLDPISAEDFLSQLKALNDELGLVVILAEHRVERCFHFADRVVVLDHGRITYAGEPSGMIEWSRGKRWVPLPPITRLFLEGKGNGVPLTVKQGRLKIADMLPARVTAEDPVAPAMPKPKRKEKRKDDRPSPAVEVSGLWHVYDGGTEAVRGVDLVIERGEFVAIVGENGSGKTSLVKHFNGLLRPDKGKVTIEGRNAKGVDVAELARTCGMLGQNPNLQLLAPTTSEELEITLAAMDVPRESWSALIDEALEMLEIAEFRGANPQDLSCGERERVALASVLVYKPDILVLDEPTRGVDQGTKDRLAAYLRRYNSEGHTIILVTHDLEFAAECCDRVLMMGNGQVLADGDKHDVLAGSLFFTTQYNKCFRGVVDGVVTREEASRALGVLR
jgi:energy-coupling factor transport system ATP-binding protein